MEDILKLVEEQTVAKSNSLRFDFSEMFDLVIKSDKFGKLDKVKFLRTIFGWRLYTCKIVIDSIIDENYTFREITDKLNFK